MAGTKELHVAVVTPERALLDTTADFVAIPMFDGEAGVLPGRAALIGRLGYGELRIRKGGTTQRLFVDGGFVQVQGDVVTVLTSRAQMQDEIKPDAVRKALDDATAGLGKAKGEEAQEVLISAQDKARAQLRVSRHAKA